MTRWLERLRWWWRQRVGDWTLLPLNEEERAAVRRLRTVRIWRESMASAIEQSSYLTAMLRGEGSPLLTTCVHGHGPECAECAVIEEDAGPECEGCL